MSSGVSGDFAGLGKLEANLRRLAEVPSRASASAAEKIDALLREEFNAQTDPYGNPWKEHAPATVERWGEHDILDLSGRMMGGMEVSPMSGAGIAVTFDVDYAEYHHTGTRYMPARPVLPLNTLPAAWEAALEEASAEAFEEILGEVG